MEEMENKSLNPEEENETLRPEEENETLRPEEDDEEGPERLLPQRDPTVRSF